MENNPLVGLSRQVALRRSLDVIANNVANMNTNGYRADSMVFEEFVMPVARGSNFSGADQRISFVHDRAAWTNMQAGSVQQTGNPLDVAISGTGFFVVQTPRGERYSRNGAFQINPNGELVTTEGYRVMSEAGPVVLQPQDRDIAIARDGTISVAGGGSRGRIRLVDFVQPGRLEKDSASTFRAPDGTAPQPALLSGMVQGAIEKSNVQGVVEMSRLIEVTRTYTAVASLIEQQSALRKTAVERLAEVPN
jgi:flagellar basal-body rod protein FlgF